MFIQIRAFRVLFYASSSPSHVEVVMTLMGGVIISLSNCASQGSLLQHFQTELCTGARHPGPILHKFKLFLKSVRTEYIIYFF